jgi:hypothetical protein
MGVVVPVPSHNCEQRSWRAAGRINPCSDCVDDISGRGTADARDIRGRHDPRRLHGRAGHPPAVVKAVENAAPWGVAFAPLAVVFGLNTIESQVGKSTIVDARIRLSVIAVFFAIACGAWMWVAAGALVPTPSRIVTAAFLRRLITAPGLRSGPARKQERGDESEKWQQ